MEIKRDDKFVINVNLKFSKEASYRYFRIREVFSHPTYVAAFLRENRAIKIY
jgi:hypothetical protein